MENGEGIGGSAGVINSSVAFQDPVADDNMYLFVTANENAGGGVPSTSTASYNVINMSSNAGLGKVIEKNQPIPGTSEGLTSIPHANGRDIWVITADKGTSKIYTTLVDKYGNIETSTQQITLGNAGGFPQEINISANGQHNKIAIGCYLDGILALYDFDNVTGNISNLQELDLGEKVYGLEFSPNGMYLYVSSYLDSSLFQLQIDDEPALKVGQGLRAPLSNAAILASRVDLSTGLGRYGHIQIGPDGRIYCPIYGVSVGAIVSNNHAAPTATFIPSILDVPGASITGALPNFMYSGCFRTAFLLPVELAYFSAIAVDNDGHLSWGTLSELNNDYFNVERSGDGIEWEVVGRVEGFGTTDEPQSYNFTDEDLEAGGYYYRLHQVDFDGTSDYSDVEYIVIEGMEAVEEDFNAHPNPVSKHGTINLTGLDCEECVLRIISIDGKVVVDEPLLQPRIELFNYDLLPGIHIIEIKNGEQVNKAKVIVGD